MTQQFDNEWKNGDRAQAKVMAMAYLDAHPELETRFAALSIEDIVSLIDTARRDGDEEARIEADIYLLANRAPQNLTGRLGG